MIKSIRRRSFLLYIILTTLLLSACLYETSPLIEKVTAGDGTLTVEWLPVPEATSYTLYLASESGVTPSNYSTKSGGRRYLNQSSPATLTGLTNGTTYYLVATATANGVESEPSSEVSGFPSGASTSGNTNTSSSGSRKLNDTGLIWGGNYPDGNNATCIGETIAQQDCSHGRDATHNDDSDGHAGFSFTKLDANGNALAASATSWSCVKDNVTGLIWEVKTDNATPDLRDKDWGYTWYNSSGVNDGGAPGVGDTGTGTTTSGDAGSDTCFAAARCDTEKFVADVNSAGLCGATDWRLPTVKELESLVNLNRYGPAIDTAYFPNTLASHFWSGSPSAYDSDDAWLVYFYYGFASDYNRNYVFRVRLVRVGQ